MKPPLLYLTNQIPFPPSKRSRLRDFYTLQVLSEHFDISLGAFIRDKSDWQYTSMLRQWCKDVFFLPNMAELQESMAWVKAWAFGHSYFRVICQQKDMQQWIDDIRIKRNIKKVYIANPLMAHYVPFDDPDLMTVVDFTRLPSERVQKRIHVSPWPTSVFLRWELEKLQQEEIDIANQADLNIGCGSSELLSFKEELKKIKKPALLLPVGVDESFYDPKLQYINPYSEDQKILVFPGSLDYWPNVDAVTWFVREIFPLVRARVPNAAFYIVGDNPCMPVQVLAQYPGVFVVDEYHDIRPYLAHAHVAVAPVQLAEMAKTQILEAISMTIPLVASKGALQNLAIEAHKPIYCENEDSEWVARIVECLMNPTDEDAVTWERNIIVKEHNWEVTLSPLLRFLGVDIEQPQWVKAFSDRGTHKEK